MTSDQYIISSIQEHITHRQSNYDFFLSSNQTNLHFFSLLARMLQSESDDTKKLLIGIGLNFLVEQNFKETPELPQHWNIFVDYIMRNTKLGWKEVKCVGKSYNLFMESFGDCLCQIVLPVYRQFAFLTKVEIQRSIVDLITTDVVRSQRIQFLSATFLDYLKQGIQYIQSISYYQLNDIDIEEGYIPFLNSVLQTVQYLQAHSQQNNKEERLFKKIALNEELFEIIRGVLMIGSIDNKCCFIFREGEIRHIYNINKLKSEAIKIFKWILGAFSQTSTIVQFDTFKPLNFMQTIVPEVVQVLIQRNHKELFLQSYELVCMAMLSFLNKAIEFMFMNNYFTQNQDIIFWKILYSLLQISDEEKRQYENQPEQFIHQLEIVVEQIIQDKDFHQRIKNYASLFLQNYLSYVDGSLSVVVTAMCDILNHISKQPNPIVEQLASQYALQLSLQTPLTILSILSLKIRKRKDLFEKVGQIFAEEGLLGVKEIDCARLFLYLSYNYEQIFKNRINGLKYLQLASSCLEGNECLSKCAIELFHSSIFVQYGEQIWNHLVSLIPVTKNSDIIKLISKVVEENLIKFSQKQVIALVQNLILRINTEYSSKPENHAHQENVYVNFCLLTIKIITGKSKFLANNSGIAGAVWQIFDFFPLFEHIDYEDSIIQIFTNVLKSVDELSPDFYQFLESFKIYHDKVEKVGCLYQTYLLLIDRGYSYLSTDGKGHIEAIIDNLQFVLTYNKEDPLREVCLLFQYILTVFPDCFDHTNLFNITKKQYLQYGKNYRDRTVAALFNYWLLGSVLHDAYEIFFLQQNTISVFKKYNARVFGYAAKMKMITSAEKKNLPQVECLLVAGLQLLGHLSERGKEICENDRSSKQIEKFREMDPFVEMRRGFEEIKGILSGEELGMVMENVYRRIPAEGVHCLLRRVEINNEPRKILSIKRPI